MPTCAFLTTDLLDGYVADDDLAVGPLAELGWTVDFVPWRGAAETAARYDLVVVRSTWDYHETPAAFAAELSAVDAVTRLENPLETIRWNLSKTYLPDLGQRGIPIVPTRIGRGGAGAALEEAFREFDRPEVVIKPAVGASAHDIHRVAAGSSAERLAEIDRLFADRSFLVQPYLPQIETEGEYSVVFFDGVYSHTLRKQPRKGDFRVQEEHGGLITAVEPPAGLMARARRVLEALPEARAPLYARVDLVRYPPDDFRLMELELIEPALYLRIDEPSARRFARAIADRGRASSGSG
ncbi:MAG: hypothetical protein PVF05_00660 [Gemmatimonadales bacterium]|jgi:glutathione synthase/RimK-type ligase-like ATP-grasp enzyme